LWLVAVGSAWGATTVGQLFDPIDGCAANSIYLQTGVASGTGYTIPSDGVVTSWSYRLDNAAISGLTLEIAGPGAAGSHTIVGQAAAGSQTPGAVNSYPAQIPVKAGDVVGIFFGSGGNCVLGTGMGGDAIDYHAGDLSPGASATFTQLTGNRLPVQVTVEPDADRDGFGDESQDSCPSEAAVDAGPCQAGPTRVGQTFEPTSGPCDQATYAQTGVAVGNSYTVPAAGVISSWSADSPAEPHADPIRFKVFRPTGAAHSYTVIAESPLEVVSGGGLRSFPARVAVRPGDLIGLYSDGNSGWCGNYPLASADTFDFLNVADEPLGATQTYNSGGLLRLDVAAAAEPDRDGDGFGDLTQDECPTDPARQTPCPVPPPARAALSKVGQSASRWREGKRLVTLSREGKPPVGTTFRFTLDRAATIGFAFTQRKPGRRAGRRCLRPNSRNRHKRRCTRTLLAGRLSFPAHQGANRAHFEGRLSRTRRLKPGRYTLAITATTAPGLPSAPKTLKFTIVK
jgi:hypothetical protein